jgi:hypothetical protein
MSAQRHIQTFATLKTQLLRFARMQHQPVRPEGDRMTVSVGCSVKDVEAGQILGVQCGSRKTASKSMRISGGAMTQSYRARRFARRSIPCSADRSALRTLRSRKGFRTAGIGVPAEHRAGPERS